VKCVLQAKKFKKSFLFLAALSCLLWIVYTSFRPQLPKYTEPLVFYSSETRDSLKWTLLSAASEAQNSIFISAFSLEEPSFLKTLNKKATSGVEVTAFYDPKHTRKYALKTLTSEVLLSPKTFSALAHRKLLIIDNERLFFGTANFTKSSLSMYSNSLIGLYNPRLCLWLKKACLENKNSSQFLSPELKLYLLPNPNALEELLTVINKAKISIQLALFTCTHPQILEALEKAANRGVRVEGVFDRKVKLGLDAKANCLEVRTYRRLGLMHQKLALIDGEILYIGSANWTSAAFTQNEDLFALITLKSASQKKKLQALFYRLRSASQKQRFF